MIVECLDQALRKTMLHSIKERPYVPATTFEILGLELWKRAPGLSKVQRERSFSALFGSSPSVCSRAWSLISHTLPNGSRPIHLLWSLLFLKIYANEAVNSALTGADPKTFRKWVKLVIEALASLKVVS